MSKVKQHYERDELVSQIDEALSKAGLSQARLSLADIAPLDHFHSRGLEATEELSEALPITAQSTVLDIGSGLGGPARFFANKFGCRVQGIDLTQSFVDLANYLTERTGLADKVSFDCGNALSLPYDDERFDFAITQHVAMNIENREQFYSEAYRVLKPGGQLALYDIVAGDNGEVLFPVPWSDGPSTSFLLSQSKLRNVLEQQGFEVVVWNDRTETAVDWFADLSKRQAASTSVASANAPSAPAAPRLGLNLIIGSDFATRASNLGRSLKERRVGLLEAVLRKPR